VQWIAANLFLLVIILAGAGVFWLLGAGVKSLSLDEDYERWLLSVVSIASIFAAYYVGKWLYRLMDRRR